VDLPSRIAAPLASRRWRSAVGFGTVLALATMLTFAATPCFLHEQADANLATGTV
jgi:hypothetical protein